jgi:large subunit ribosomal protein L17
MRHLRTVSKLNRNKSHRRALLMNMANSLFQHESIKTTDTKAMELRRVADRLITLAKRKDLHAMRLVFAFLRDKAIVKKLFADIGDRYLSINGGYTRVLKIGRRKGDAAPMAIIELTQKREPEDKAKKETKEQPKKEAKEKKPKKEATEKPKRARKVKEEKKEEA